MGVIMECCDHVRSGTERSVINNNNGGSVLSIYLEPMPTPSNVNKEIEEVDLLSSILNSESNGGVESIEGS